MSGSRSTKQEIADRREKVLELRMQRLSARQIGEVLHVSQSTVVRDLRVIKKELHEKLEGFNAKGEIAAILEAYDIILGESLRESDKAKDFKKIGFLNSALRALWQKQRLLLDLGVLSEVTETRVLEYDITIRDPEMGEEEWLKLKYPEE